MKKHILILFLLVAAGTAAGQTGRISGKVISGEEPLAFVNIAVKKDGLSGTVTDDKGNFTLERLPYGEHIIVVSHLGYESLEKTVVISDAEPPDFLEIQLLPLKIVFDQVVITGTRTFKRQTSSPVIVNVISSQALDGVQACNLSEGLKFQPGLRVETDCQTCNYTQLRMNGLAGGYSQILINGRPVFSPLTGLYGMEQIPANMIERIEVVRGGGSALYGSSAIGGTVNVITKIPEKNAFDLGYTYQTINGEVNDHILFGNATLVNPKKNAGVTLFLSNRNRPFYDHNGDNFSELPEMRNNSFGVNMFFQPAENQKLEIGLSSLNEYRYGGEMVGRPAYLALQAEERTHRVVIGNLDYQVNFNNDNSSVITYLAAQNTDREHYTGILPDEEDRITRHLENPPYGTSANITFQAGLQINHRLRHFPGKGQVITAGTEYIVDDVLDIIEAYRYRIDQRTKNLGVFLQSDWEITPQINLLTGLRFDRHNLVGRPIWSPRISLLYKLKGSAQFRLTYSAGFRAPQAFDADLHIAFAGGGVSRISLDPNLREERSGSFSGSVNYDKVSEHWIAGFTLEGFFTKLDRAFYLVPAGEDEFGERFIKKNGTGSTVKGITLEWRANYDQKAQLEAGFTVQSSLFDDPVEYLDGLAARREFLRTPNEYGYATLSLFPKAKWNTTLSLVYTGRMEIAHFAGAPGQETDEFVTSDPFVEWSVKTGYTLRLNQLDTGLELFGGVKNITNAYQDDFDSGKNRDSNYIYGPALPRSLFFGLRLRSVEGGN